LALEEDLLIVLFGKMVLLRMLLVRGKQCHGLTLWKVRSIGNGTAKNDSLRVSKYTTLGKKKIWGGS